MRCEVLSRLQDQDFTACTGLIYWHSDCGCAISLCRIENSSYLSKLSSSSSRREQICCAFAANSSNVFVGCLNMATRARCSASVAPARRRSDDALSCSESTRSVHVRTIHCNSRLECLCRSSTVAIEGTRSVGLTRTPSMVMIAKVTPCTLSMQINAPFRVSVGTLCRYVQKNRDNPVPILCFA